MKNLKQRFLLVSDMHYTTEETDEELRLLYPDARTSVAAGNAFGRTQRQKIDKVTEAVVEENAGMYPAEYPGTPLVDIGGYAYAGHVVNGKYTFNSFDEAWAWGYEILEIYEDGVRMYHVKPTMDYKGDNGDFHVERIVSGELEIARK